MIREEKLISIAVLTVLMYALGIFLDASFFLIPFPLFDVIFFVVFTQLLIWNRTHISLYVWIFYLVSFIQLIYNPLISGILFTNIKLHELDRLLVFDVLKLGVTVLLCTTVVLWNYQKNLRIPFGIIGIVFVMFFISLIGSLYWLTPIPSIILGIAFWKYDQKNPFRYLWVLQGIFDFFTVLMLSYST